MDETALRVFVSAHAAFAVLALLLLTNVCEASPDVEPNVGYSVGNLEYISEKLMQCEYSPTQWHRLPQVISAVMWLILLQHYATFVALAPEGSPHQHNGWDLLFQVLVVGSIIVVGRADPARPPPHVPEARVGAAAHEQQCHVHSVLVFMSCFFGVHVLVSLRYLSAHARHPRFAMLRRCSYFAVDAVYAALCVLFCVFAILSKVSHAIFIEYVVALLFYTLNTASLIILLRISASEALDSTAPGSP